MPRSLSSTGIIVSAWETSSRVTAFLVEGLPDGLLAAPIPGMPRRTIGMLCGHMHNARCMWVGMLGREHGLKVPAKIDRRRAGRNQILTALDRSGDAVARLLQLGCENGGRIPPSRSYAWRNLQLDVGHVLSYLVAHEAHHRGQIVLAARQLGEPLDDGVTNGLWQWRQRAREAASR